MKERGAAARGVVREVIVKRRDIRIHSSTITIAVLDEDVARDITIRAEDLEWTPCRSPGKGGQHVHKTDSAVQLTHLPTGMQIRVHGERSQHRNRATATDQLRERLADAERAARAAERANARRVQVGTGMRGDKRRTIRVQTKRCSTTKPAGRGATANYVRGMLQEPQRSRRATTARARLRVAAVSLVRPRH